MGLPLLLASLLAQSSHDTWWAQELGAHDGGDAGEPVLSVTLTGVPRAQELSSGTSTYGGKEAVGPRAPRQGAPGVGVLHVPWLLYPGSDTMEGHRAHSSLPPSSPALQAPGEVPGPFAD